MQEGILTEWTDSVKQALNLANSFSDAIVILGTTSVISETEQKSADAAAVIKPPLFM